MIEFIRDFLGAIGLAAIFVWLFPGRKSAKRYELAKELRRRLTAAQETIGDKQCAIDELLLERAEFVRENEALRTALNTRFKTDPPDPGIDCEEES